MSVYLQDHLCMKPGDKSLFCREADDIKRFLGDYSAYVDGGSEMDECIQVKFFILDKEIKTVIGSMKGSKRKKIG